MFLRKGPNRAPQSTVYYRAVTHLDTAQKVPLQRMRFESLKTFSKKWKVGD